MKFLLFGITQGLTEFFPISSSGHLYLLEKIFKLNDNLLSFFVLLHLATLVVILIFFHNQIKNLLLQKKILAHLFIITIITGILGLVIKHFFVYLFDYKYTISFFIFINALILLSTKNVSGNKTLKDFTLKDSIILGILQGIAVFPGISRSGITISALLKRGFQSKEAFSLSFIMAIPVILGAFLMERKEIFSNNTNILNISFSGIAAFFSGIVALKIMKKTLMKIKLHNFGYYCLFIFLLTLFL